ncbi:MAG: hypothetical protein HQM16_17965 [Deltaproteobacteria bacterium]|nr:hypothetical protein [Deltaproteobacteria bacterium]
MMGDGIRKKIAIMINAGEEREVMQDMAFQESLNRTNKALGEGWERHVASKYKPESPVASYTEATVQGVKDLIASIKSDDDDDVLVYLASHGAKTKDGYHIVLQDGLIKDSDFFEMLGQVPYGNRTIVNGNCFGGSGINVPAVFRNPHTAYYAASGDEEAYISAGVTMFVQKSIDFTSAFFAADVDVNDENRDGYISFRERFLHAMRDRQGLSIPKYFVGTQYEDCGITCDAPEAHPYGVEPLTVTQPDELDDLLNFVSHAGGFAVVAFINSKDSQSKIIKEKVAAFARETDGRYQTIFVEASDWQSIRWSKFELGDNPKVRLYDANRLWHDVIDIEKISEEFRLVGANIAQRVSLALDRLFEKDSGAAILGVATLLTKDKKIAEEIANTLFLSWEVRTDKGWRARAISVLGVVGSCSDTVLNRLLPLLKPFLYSEDLDLQQAAAGALREIGARAEGMIDAMIDAAHAKLERAMLLRLHCDAIRTGRINNEEDVHAFMLYQELMSLVNSMTEVLAALLIKVPEKIESALPFLMAGLKTGDDSVMMVVATAIEKISQEYPDELRKLVPIITSIPSNADRESHVAKKYFIMGVALRHLSGYQEYADEYRRVAGGLSAVWGKRGIEPEFFENTYFTAVMDAVIGDADIGDDTEPKIDEGFIRYLPEMVTEVADAVLTAVRIKDGVGGMFNSSVLRRLMLLLPYAGEGLQKSIVDEVERMYTTREVNDQEQDYFGRGILAYASLVPNQTQRFLPHIQEALQSPHESVRVTACIVVGRYGAAGAGMLSQLMAISKEDASADVRVAALRSLAMIAPADEVVVQRVFEGLSDGETKIQMVAIKAVKQLFEETNPAAEKMGQKIGGTLIKTAESGAPNKLKDEALKSIAKMEGLARGYTARLIALGNSAELDIAFLAITALGKTAKDSIDDVVPSIRKWLENDDVLIKTAALLATGFLGPCASGLFADMTGLLNSDHDGVLRGALTALIRMEVQSNDDVVKQGVLKATRHKNKDVRDCAVRASGILFPNDIVVRKRATEILLDDPIKQVRDAAQAGLKEVGPINGHE